MARPHPARLVLPPRSGPAWGRPAWVRWGWALGLALALGACERAPDDGPGLTVAVAPTATGGPPAPEAAPSRYAIERLTEADGLSNTSVISMTQDADGFMWFGTWNGLNRYDGHAFTVYEHDPDDPRSLPHSWAEALYLDPAGALWVGTFGGGLARYDPEADGFTTFRHDPDDPTTLSQDTVTAVLRDAAGALWVGTHRGLNRLDERTGAFTRYLHDPDDPASLSNDQVRGLYQDREGSLWIATGSTTLSETPVGVGGLNRYDPEADAFVRYLHDPDDPASLYHNKVRSMIETPDGTFWVGTAGNVLHRMDRAAGTFERLAFDPARPDRLVPAASVSIPTGCGDPCGTVTFMALDPAGRLWAGAHSVGLLILEGDRVVRHYAAGPDLDEQIGSDLPWAAAFSADGTAWLGTLNGGLHRMTRPPAEDRRLFEHAEIAPPDVDDGDQNAYFDALVTGVAAAPDGSVWVSLKDGLDRYDPASGTATRVPVRPGDSTAVDGPISRVLVGADGSLWALGYTGTLHRRRPGGAGFERVDLRLTGPFADSFELLFKDRSAAALYETSDGAVWVGTLGDGLRRYDPASGALTVYPAAPEAPGGWPGGDVVDFEEVGGALWAATEAALVRLDAGARERPVRAVVPAPLGRRGQPVVPTDLFRDRRGRLLLGSSGGVFVVAPEAGADGAWAVEPLVGEPSALIGDASVGSLAEDADGHLWISTYDGPPVVPVNGRMVRYDPEAQTVLDFDVGDGLPSIGFRERTAARAPDGTLFVGGVPGFVAVTPALVEGDAPPRTVLTDLRVFDEPVRPGPAAPLREHVLYAEEAVLDHDENDFTLSYVGIDFRAPEEVRYQHRLVPYDREWVEAGDRRSVRYSRVPPGDYTFEVRASNRYGVWAADPTVLAVRVRPPWWQTWWAYALYALALVAGLVVVDRVRRVQVIRRERAKTEKEREAALLREKELMAEAAQAHADYLEAENRRQTQELEQKRQIEEAYRELEVSHAELRQAQDRLVQQEKLASLGQLTAGIAHEIKNPLNFVNNFAELNRDLAREVREAIARGDAAEAAEVAADLEQNAALIQQHGRRADSIVKNMMAHARAGAGQVQRVDLNALVEEHIDLAYHGKRSQGMGLHVVIERDLDPAVGAVEVVPQEIGRVLLNLLSNAFDAVAGRDDAAVTVATARSGDRVEVRVADNGAGIPEAARSKIFEPFFTTKPTGEGTGLGLSMSYDIVVHGYGGTLTVESAEGAGSTFVVALPLPAVEPPAASGPASGDAASGGAASGPDGEAARTLT